MYSNLSEVTIYSINLIVNLRSSRNTTPLLLWKNITIDVKNVVDL